MLDLVSWPPEAAVRGAAAMRQHSHLGFLCVQSEALGLLVHTQPRWDAAKACLQI